MVLVRKATSRGRRPDVVAQGGIHWQKPAISERPFPAYMVPKPSGDVFLR